jgi:hypothetical protein
MDKNVRPKYVKKKKIIDFGAFCSLLPKSSIINDLQYAFNERYHLLQAMEEIQEEKKNSKPSSKMKKDKKTKKKKAG